MKIGAFIVFAFLLNIQTGLPSAGGNLAPVDSTVRSFFAEQDKLDRLNFPNSTYRFYQSNNFRYVWLTSANSEVMSEALRLLNCVAPFGLSSKDYHPEVLQEMLTFNEDDRTEKEVMLSDALITLIAHLHFGAANPDAPPAVTDNEDYKLFRLEKVLQDAIYGSFRETILKVQPESPGYIALQTYLSQATGRFTGECKELSTDTLKLVALNLERYRWMNDGSGRLSVMINVPAFMLRVENEGAVTEFKIVVGKPGTPTPQLSSAIRYLNTAPDWNVPARIFRTELLPKMLKDPSFASRNNFLIYDDRGRNIAVNIQNLRLIESNPAKYTLKQSSCCDNALGQIVFRFQNMYNVYLHDTPEKSYFLRPTRALSHGCIRVENPRKLLAILLTATRADKEAYTRITRFMDSNTKYTYTFSRPIPIYIRYLTCEVRNGQLTKYNDVYNKDKALTSILFD